MKYTKKGITIAILIAVIVVLLIIVSAVTVSYFQIKVSTQKRAFANEIYTIGKLYEKYNLEHDNADPEKGDFTLDMNSIHEKSKEQFAGEPGYTSGILTLTKLDLSAMDVETVNRGLEKEGETDIYAFSKDTGKVYYIQGEKIGNTVYYTLTDELRSLLAI